MRIFFFLFICVFNVTFGQPKDSSAVVKTSIETPKTSLKDSIKKIWIKAVGKTLIIRSSKFIKNTHFSSYFCNQV